MKRAALSEVRHDLSKSPRISRKEEVVITPHGKAAGILIGFGREEDWLDYRLEHDSRFLRRICAARAGFRVGSGVRLEELPKRTRLLRHRKTPRISRTAGVTCAGQN